MECKNVTMDMQALMEKYRQMLPLAESLPLRVTGSSMAPFLVHRRDTVWLSSIRSELKPGDMVLYQRDSGRYILHRICKAKGDRYTLIGDAHTVMEPGVRRDQIFARVCQVERKGKIIKPGSFWWEFFARVWIHLIPLRRPLLRMVSLGQKIKRRIKS